MTNKEILDARNEQIKRITQTLARKQVSPTDMLQARVDGDNSCAYLFYNYKGTDLSFIKGLDTSNATDMMYMFNNCTNLESVDLSNFNTENVTNMSSMFGSCSSLASLDISNFNTENVTNMSSMFYDCSSLTSLDLSSFNTSKVSNFQQIFRGCTNLTKVIGEIDLIKATNTSSMFIGTTSLTDVTLKNIKKLLEIGNGTSYGFNLSNATLINIIQELWDLTGSTSQTLYMSTASKNNITNIYVKLIDVTDEMLAQDPYAANKKPCVVCEPTDEGAMTITEYAISKNWAIA
jgi:surface protein